MNPPPQSHTRDRLARIRPLLHWRVLAPVLGGAVMPKCLLCAAAYAGGGAALLGIGPELCGDDGRNGAAWLVPPLIGATLGAGVAVWRRRRRPKSTRCHALD